MIHLTFYRIRPAKLDQLKAWFAEPEERADEVRETFAQVGVDQLGEQFAGAFQVGERLVVVAEEVTGARQATPGIRLPAEVLMAMAAPSAVRMVAAQSCQ